jgi:tetratricopeptide (TPR) repeat protein
MSVIPQYEPVKKRFSNAERREQIKASIYFKKKMNTGSQDNARINHMMGALAEAGGDTKNAKLHYQNAIVNAPANVLSRSDYAEFMAKQGKAEFLQAQDEFRKALILDADHPQLRKNYGAVLGRKGRYREAQENTTRALQLRPNDAMAHRNLAMINNQLGDNHLALKHNMEAIKHEVKTIGDPHARDSNSYRRAAVQTISTGGSHEKARALMDTARAIEKKRAVLPTTEKTNQLLMMMFDRRGDAAAELQREAEVRRKQLEEEEAAMKSGDVTHLLAKVRARQDALKKNDDD